mgnify:CR=1 FL=1
MGEGRFQEAEVAQAVAAAALAQQTVMKYQHLAQTEVPHLGETSIELAIGVEHPLGGLLEFLGRYRYKIPDRSGSKVGDGHLEPSGCLSKASLRFLGELDRQRHVFPPP